MRTGLAIRGEGRIKLILTLVGIAAVFFAGFKFIPVKMANSALEDACVEEAKFAQEPGRTIDIMRGNIWDTVVRSGLDTGCGLQPCFDKKDIQINNESSRIRIEIEYDRPVELPGYTYIWHFHIYVDRQKF